jgi:hypothetical protein
MKITRSQKPGVRSQKLKNSFVCYSLLITILLPSVVAAAEKWSGVDEAVVEKIAKEHGREAREPVINTDKGDLLLFVFLLAGALITGEHSRKTKNRTQKAALTKRNRALTSNYYELFTKY